MRGLIVLVVIILAYCVAGKVDAADLTRVYEDSQVRGYVYKGNTEIFKDIFIISTYVEVKSRMKKSRTTVDEDYVINCNTNTYHTENSITTYNGIADPQYRWTEDETEIYEGFPLKLKEIVCKGVVAAAEPCVKVEIKNEAQRRYLTVYFAEYNKTICK